MATPCINVMAVGDAGCGKTCLFTRISKDQFWDEPIPVNFQNGDVDSDSENKDVDELVDIVFGRNELTISFFSTSGETFVRLARMYG